MSMMSMVSTLQEAFSFKYMYDYVMLKIMFLSLAFENRWLNMAAILKRLMNYFGKTLELKYALQSHHECLI